MIFGGEGLAELSHEIIESLQTRIIVLNQDGDIVAVNRAYKEFSFKNGQDEKTVRGLGLSYFAAIHGDSFMSPKEASKALAGLSAILNGVSSTFELVYACHGPNTSGWFILNFAKMTQPEGGVLISHTDITEHQKAEAALQEANLELAQQIRNGTTELDRFFSVALDMLCIFSSEGFFLRVNPAVTSVLGWSAEELTAKPLYDFLHPEDQEATRERIEREADGSISTSFENRYRNKDGSWRTIAWRSVKVEGGLLYATGRDVTEQRALEDGLRLAKDEAERANAAKNEFLSRMSHELRTPMNAVLGYAQLLELKYEDPGIKHATSAIMKGGKHLLQLINEVLDLSRIESGTLGISIEPVAVDRLISHAVSLLKQTAEDAEVRLIYPQGSSEIFVHADKQRLLQVFLNVIGNAIKFNHKGGIVNVQSISPSGEYHRIEVSDTGSGIDLESQALLFQPFQRFGDPGIDGTGLGLAISERFVRLMGGAIGLAESSSSGSTFFIELKRDQSPEAQVIHSDALRHENPARLSRGKVLYIEDNLSNVSLVETILEDWQGIKLFCAMQGRLGIELASSHQPNLILLDVHLPDLMGDKVLEMLKASPITQNIPVVMLSADVTPRQINASMELGAEEYLTKPIDISKLFEILNRFLPSPTQ